MAYPGPPNHGYPPSSSRTPHFPPVPAPPAMDEAAAGALSDPQFDIFEWYTAYQSCQRFFLDHSQHEHAVQAIAALMNICLPFQWTQSPIMSSYGHPPRGTGPGAYPPPWPRHGALPSSQQQGALPWASLIPYIRRLVVTGFDKEGILHGFFGDDWRKGVGPLQECERRNYLFAAKSVGWAKVKSQYDMGPHEAVPFLKPLQNAQLAEIESAEKTWSQWLAMEDWMVGPRAPESMDDDPSNGSERQEGA